MIQPYDPWKASGVESIHSDSETLMPACLEIDQGTLESSDRLGAVYTIFCYTARSTNGNADGHKA